MNNTAIQIAFSSLLFAKLWLRSEEGEPDYSNMEVIKTLMIIQSLLMGVTMAYKVLGASKRDHILKSLDRAELNEEISEDKPDVRRKLTHDASGISMDVKFYYKFPCTSEKVSFHAVKYTNHPQGTIKWVSQKSFYQEVCKEGESVNIGNIQHKVCNPGNPPHMYCFTKTKTRYANDLLFDLFLKRNNDANWSDLKRTQKGSMFIKYGVGCDCGWQFHTGDSDESRTGEQ